MLLNKSIGPNDPDEPEVTTYGLNDDYEETEIPLPSYASLVNKNLGSAERNQILSVDNRKWR